MAERFRIKDLAKKSGVSVGTVDRVLHNRPNVSEEARKKVEAAIKELNYQPNVYASALAYNKQYNFVLFMPEHESETYWEEIEKGSKEAEKRRRDFNIEITIMYYNRLDNASFTKCYEKCLETNPDGVIIVPSTLDVTRMFTDELHKRQIPFILLDSYMPDLRPLSFFGQDSFSSGYFAAKMLMLIAQKDKQIMLLRPVKDGNVNSKQQANREVGFRHYMKDHFPEVEIINLDIPIDGTKKEFNLMFDRFFASHPDVHNCITLASKAHLVGEYLSRTNKRDVQIMGYDMVGKNANCLREGSISFLICQHAFQQGYSCVDTLFKAIVLKQKVDAVNYMPIELITKENCEYYRRDHF